MSRCFLASSMFLSTLSLGLVGCGGETETIVVPAETMSDAEVQQMQEDSEAARKEQAKYD